MMAPGNVSFEYVRFAGKVPSQISHHVKDGITEDFVRSRVLFTSKEDREYLPDGSYKLAFKVKHGNRKPILVEIYVRERKYNSVITEYVVYGVHVTKAKQK